MTNIIAYNLDFESIFYFQQAALPLSLVGFHS